MTPGALSRTSAVVSVVLALLGVVGAFVANARLMGPAFNADAIQMPAVFADIFERGGSFRDWNIAPAPAIVPEYGMYAIAYVIGGTLFFRVLTYSLLQILLLWAMVYGVGIVAGVKNAMLAASLTVTAMTLLCLLRVHNYLQVVQSAFHFGGFLLQILAFALVVLLWRTPGARRQLLMLALVAGVTLVASFNDALFVIQMVVPLCAVAVVAVISRRLAWRRGLVFVAVIGASAFLGFKLYPRLMPHPTTSLSKFDPSGIAIDTADISDTVVSDPVSLTVFVLLSTMTIALGVIAGLELLQKKRFLPFVQFPSDPIRVLAVSALLASAASVGAILLTSASSSLRYVLPLYYWPLIIIPMLLVNISGRWASVGASATALVLGLTSTVFGVNDVVANGVHTDYYSTSQACVDAAVKKYGVRHALGTYWVTKPIQELSREGITVTTVSDIRGQNFWVASYKNQFDAYDAFIDQNAHPSPDILRDLKKHAGDPVHTVKCKRYTVNIWEPGTIQSSDLIQK